MRFAVFASATAAAILVVAILAAGGSAQQPGERTFVLIETGGTFSFVDVPPKAPNRRNPRISAGDMLAITSQLRQGGQRVGNLYAECIAVRRARRFNRARFQCNGSFDLRDGTLALSAVLKGNQENPTIAVIGGTGAYEGARGSVTSRNLSGDRTEDTVHLLP
jgi:hypothetical protein